MGCANAQALPSHYQRISCGNTLTTMTKIITAAVILTTICLTPKVGLASEQIKQLLATNECQNCDLRGAGLVQTNLSGAILRGANLSGANLSRANLSGANLSGANLHGASLFGANLSGANLNAANLHAADLRDTYLVNAQLTGNNINEAYLQGAVGISSQIATIEDFYRWGVEQGEKGDPKRAIAYFDQALSINPNFAAAYLARGVARYQLFDRPGAINDANVAAKIFFAQGNQQGYQTAQTFTKELSRPSAATTESKPNFWSSLGAIGSVLLRFLF